MAGKTTICKALAQKVYIRNSDRYSSGVLLEVNSHSLFSKWYGCDLWKLNFAKDIYLDVYVYL
jgi:hypothetical protein